MQQAVVVDAVRTPMGRSKGGAFRNVRAEDLSVALVRALLERNPALEPKMVDEVIWAAPTRRSSRDSISPASSS